MVSWLGMEKVGLAWDRLPGLLSGVGRPYVKPPEGVDVVLLCLVEVGDEEKAAICSSLLTGAMLMILEESPEEEEVEVVELVGEVVTDGLLSAKVGLKKTLKHYCNSVMY